MIGKFKYIMFEGTTGADPVIFPPWIDHDSMQRMMRWPAISAGFVTIFDGEVNCTGRSVSLNLPSNPEVDNKIIAKLFGIS